MNKDEVLSLGVKEARYREFQEMYSRDVNRAAKREAAMGGGTDGTRRGQEEAEQIRAAIASMLPMIRDTARLRFLLEAVNRQFHYQGREEERKQKGAAMGVCENQDQL